MSATTDLTSLSRSARSQARPSDLRDRISGPVPLSARLPTWMKTARNCPEIPARLRLSLTWDRGREMAQHQELTAACGTAVFCCDPASPWQRGSNENTTRLLRQYLAKNADRRTLTQGDLDDVAARINGRLAGSWAGTAPLSAPST